MLRTYVPIISAILMMISTPIFFMSDIASLVPRRLSLVSCESNKIYTFASSYDAEMKDCQVWLLRMSESGGYEEELVELWSKRFSDSTGRSTRSLGFPVEVPSRVKVWSPRKLFLWFAQRQGSYRKLLNITNMTGPNFGSGDGFQLHSLPVHLITRARNSIHD